MLGGANATYSCDRLDYTDLNFHEIPEAFSSSEIPHEVLFQITNVLTVTEIAIEKLKISLILPKIFENPKILHRYLTNTKYEASLKLVTEYREKKKSESLEEADYMDYQLLEIIDYFQDNYKILRILPSWLDDIDDAEKTLLKAFEVIYQVAKERFHRPATADLAREKRLHEVYWANENVKIGIKNCLRRIYNNKLNRLWKYAAKSGIIKKMEDELALHEYDNNMFIKQKNMQSIREIQKLQIVFNSRHRELEEDLEKSRSAYKKILKVDLLHEKKARDEKNKLQLQLEALINKFDQSLLDKYNEELSLQDAYDREKEELEEIMLEYKREESIYDEIVLKREREYKRLHDAKVSLFIQTRVAKRIQRWWRKYFRVKKKKQKQIKKSKCKKDKDNGGGKEVANKDKKPVAKEKAKKTKANKK